MARNTKPGITFYRKDSGHITHPKVRLLVNEYDSDGYYIWCCLLDYAYGRWGYYFDMNDQDELELFATDYCRNKLSLIKEVIAGCIRRGLFDKTVADLFGILTCDFMQEVFVYATADRRKKGSVFEMQENWLLLDFKGQIPGNIVIVPGKNRIVPGKNPQTKQNKTETKQEDSAPATPAPPRTGKKKRVEESKSVNPCWQPFVKTIFDFVKEEFGEDLQPVRDDFKVLGRLHDLLKARAEKKGQLWTPEQAAKSFLEFLKYARQMNWLGANFTIQNLEKQYNAIIQNAAKSKLPARAPIVQMPKTFNDEVKYFLGRYQEGELNSALLSEEFCRKLIVRSGQNIDLEAYPGNTEADRLRAAVISIFASMSKKEVPA